MTPDPGPPFVDDLFARLLIDDAWALRDERSFSWWPHRVVQRVRAEEPVGEGDAAASRVHIETDVLFADSVTLRQAGTLADLLRYPPLASFVVDREDGVVRLWSAALVTKETAPIALGFLSAAAALQAIYAEAGREELENELGLPAAASEHPRSGARPHPDTMLDLLRARIAPEGARTSRFTDPSDWAGAAEALRPFGARAEASPRGLDARLPFLDPFEGSHPLGARSSALLQGRHADRHPEMGVGVFLRLFLPLDAAPAAADIALNLNAKEREMPFAIDATGAWTIDSPEATFEFGTLPGPPRLCYVRFVPNALHLPGLLATLAVDMARRADRAREHLHEVISPG
ncbi:MAG: hypothetical protein WCC53_04910 [Thermoanaerobaculia bacterium]|jgi:hypothetical protein